MCPRNPSSHSLSSYASWDSLALDSVLPGAMSQHQMPHQLFLRGLRHPPFQFFRNPQPQLQAYLPDSLSLPPFFLFKKMRQAPNLLQTLTEGASGNRQGSARPRGPDGPPGAGRAGSRSAGGWTGGGRSTYRHPDRRDWWQTEASPLRAEVSAGTPPNTTGVRVRPRKEVSSGKNSGRDGLSAARDNPSSPRPPATAAAAAAAARAEEPRRPRTRSLSGIWVPWVSPVQNLPRTCPAETGPTPEPPPPGPPLTGHTEQWQGCLPFRTWPWSEASGGLGPPGAPKTTNELKRESEVEQKEKGSRLGREKPSFPRAPMVVTSLWSLGRRMETPFLI